MKIQRLKNGQFVLTLPKRIVELKGWQKGDELKVLDHDKDSLVLRKV